MIRNDLRHRSIRRLAEQGRAQMVGAIPDAIYAVTAIAVEPEYGTCAIVNKLIATGFSTADSSPGEAEPSLVLGYSIIDEYSNIIASGRFLSFDRINSIHGLSTPDWRTAMPCKPIVFEPPDPIIVPPKCRLVPSYPGSLLTNDMGGGNWAARGYIVSVGDARALGYDVPEMRPNDDSPNILDMRSSTVGATLTATAVEILAGRAGKCIQILHVHIRQQQGSHAPTITGTIRQSDDTVFFKFCNNNPTDFAEWIFSPEEVFFDEGEGIEVLGDTGINATVTISYRFVDAADVPSDAWWSYMVPGLPTPAGGTTGLASLYTTRGATFTLRYPGLGTTGTTPGKGKQHIVSGYALSVQKDLTVVSDALYMALTTGTAEGAIGLAGSTTGITTTNNLISPIIAASGHDQCIFLAESDLDVPCPPDTGLILLDMTATGGAASTPAASDLDVDEIHVLVWGRTVPTRVKSTSHFRGEV